jgi:peptidoglycan hydrolase-like protein with peptidoglycan-binding domain
MVAYINLGSRFLKRGTRGTDVELLQNMLKALPDNIGSSIKEKTSFGAETEAAVKKFQKYFNLNVDGIVGNNTFLYLGVPTGPYLPKGSALFGSRNLRKGDYGSDVGILQNRLASTAAKFANALGHPADKSFDARTETAVKMFQRDVHLPDDGIVGSRTFYQLYYNTGMGGRTLQGNRPEQNRGYDVYWLQRHLNELGYYKDALDAVLGPNTEAAVKALQSGVAIRADGIVGVQTYFYLASI